MDLLLFCSGLAYFMFVYFSLKPAFSLFRFFCTEFGIRLTEACLYPSIV